MSLSTIRPDDVTPRWAETAGGSAASNITEPSSGQKDTGFTTDQIPPSGYQNWWQRIVYHWVKWLRDQPSHWLIAAINWTRKRDSGTGNNGNNLAIAFGADASTPPVRWVAVGWDGTNGTISRSTDGAAWTAATLGTVIFRSVTQYATNKWLLVGDSGKIYTSPDAITWTLRTSGTVDNLNGVAQNGSLIVAVGTAGTILTSTDGITWTARTSALANDLFAVAWDPTQALWVAVGATGTVESSPDGINWTDRSTSTAYDWYAIATDGFGRWLVAGYKTTATTGGYTTTSSDGTTWATPTRLSQQNSTLLQACAFFGDATLVAGTNFEFFAAVRPSSSTIAPAATDFRTCERDALMAQVLCITPGSDSLLVGTDSPYIFQSLSVG